MTLSALRDDIVTKLGESLGSPPAGPTITVNGGRFDVEELARQSKTLPAVVVAVLGIPRTEVVGGTARLLVDFGAFVVVKDSTKGGERWSTALDLAASVTAKVAATRFGDNDSGRPTDVRAQNFFSKDLDAKGVAIWGVTWRMTQMVLDVDIEASLVPFETLKNEFDLAPADETVDATDELQLEQPEPEPEPEP